MIATREALLNAQDALTVAQAAVARALAGLPSESVYPGVEVNPLPRLTEADYRRAASRLGVSVPIVKAVADVESGRDGPFDSLGRPTVLFEPHKFSEFTGHRFDETHGGVSYRKWKTRPYPTGTADERNQANWAKIEYAAALPDARDAAYRSASYGRFQIMGFNWKVCGYPSLDDFLDAMRRSEAGHLDAFIGYIEANNLARHLTAGRWVDFAAGYNGSGQADAYGVKIAAAVAKWSAL